MKNLHIRAVVASFMIAATWPAHCGSGISTPADFRSQVAKNLTMSVTAAPPGTGKILLIGTIDRAMANYVKQTVDADSRIDTFLVDSYGGDVDSAMDIAEIILQRKMRLIVDGRCLSACANYLFPAAFKKTVLPGSVVGIHGMTTYYSQNGVLKPVTESAAGQLFRSSSRAADLAAFNRMLARQRDFYQRAGLAPEAHLAFARYLARRKEIFGTDVISPRQHASGCPPLQMWAMDPQQWQALGVKGIESFWYPATVDQRVQLQRDLGLPADFMYYGATSGLEQLCTTPQDMITKLRDWLVR